MNVGMSNMNAGVNKVAFGNGEEERGNFTTEYDGYDFKGRTRSESLENAREWERRDIRKERARIDRDAWRADQHSQARSGGLNLFG